MEKLEKISQEETNSGNMGKMSFAEQFLERPVFAGSYGNSLANVTVTCCTYRGIPTIDDF